MLIKLVAIETALVGWLSYWLFLVYATNPSVAQGLADKLSKFPQLSFTTVDISVLIIIGIISLLLALKFQRGLKPGIRLERALQMLETLMKRNLFLESQVAELKLERGPLPQPQSFITSLPTPAPSTAHAEPQTGSWERAFRIPIEAGPFPPTSPAKSPSGQSSTFDNQLPPRPTPIPKPETKSPTPPPITSKPSLMPDKPPQSGKGPEMISYPDEKTRTVGPTPTSPTWEDSPRRVLEASGIMEPVQETRTPSALMPDTPLAKAAPATSTIVKGPPPGVVIGPGVSPRSERNPFRRMLQLPPTIKPGQAVSAAPSSASAKTAGLTSPPESSEEKKPPDLESKPAVEEGNLAQASDSDEIKPEGKPRPVFKRRFAFEEKHP